MHDHITQFAVGAK